MLMLNGKDSFWLQLEVCREYQRSRCSRADEECKFAHPPTNVEVQSNGRVTACYDSMKGRCQRETCKYMHPPAHLKDQLLINGRNHLALKNALLQQHSSSSTQFQAAAAAAAATSSFHRLAGPLVAPLATSQLPFATSSPNLNDSQQHQLAANLVAAAALSNLSSQHHSGAQLPGNQQQQQQQTSAAASISKPQSSNSNSQNNPISADSVSRLIPFHQQSLNRTNLNLSQHHHAALSSYLNSNNNKNSHQSHHHQHQQLIDPGAFLAASKASNNAPSSGLEALSAAANPAAAFAAAIAASSFMGGHHGAFGHSPAYSAAASQYAAALAVAAATAASQQQQHHHHHSASGLSYGGLNHGHKLAHQHRTPAGPFSSSRARAAFSPAHSSSEHHPSQCHSHHQQRSVPLPHANTSTTTTSTQPLAASSAAGQPFSSGGSPQTRHGSAPLGCQLSPPNSVQSSSNCSSSVCSVASSSSSARCPSDVTPGDSSPAPNQSRPPQSVETNHQNQLDPKCDNLTREASDKQREPRSENQPQGRIIDDIETPHEPERIDGRQQMNEARERPTTSENSTTNKRSYGQDLKSNSDSDSSSSSATAIKTESSYRGANLNCSDSDSAQSSPESDQLGRQLRRQDAADDEAAPRDPIESSAAVRASGSQAKRRKLEPADVTSARAPQEEAAN